MVTSYINWLAKIKDILLDSIFPNPVISNRLPIYKTLFCAICRARLPNNKKICHKGAQYLLGAATNYDQQAVRQTIWRLKYRNRTGLAKPLADILIKYAAKLDLDWGRFIVIPVPLSQARLRNRGYNQSELIARIFSESFQIELNKTALVRTKNTPPQMEIRDWEARKKNIIGAFGVAKPELIKGKNIILIDDVFTSGATMNEAAHQLKDSGAKQIIGLVVAKAG
ncbi:MAG: ComF family protein [bacterium]|nr:ComF family protein [bacterium]